VFVLVVTDGYAINVNAIADKDVGKGGGKGGGKRKWIKEGKTGGGERKRREGREGRAGGKKGKRASVAR
jgi:hypothetical protein